MLEAHPALVSIEEYFRLDAQSDTRLEYWNGHVVAMAGETRNHAVVKDDAVRSIERQRPDCLAVTASLRVVAPGYGRQNYAYPDGILVCGEEQYDHAQPPTLLNPTLLIEVTSSSTKALDLDDKFEAYFKIESLQEYWIIDSDRVYVRRCVRIEKGVLITPIQDVEAVIESAALNLTVLLTDIYRRVDWDRR